MYLGLGERAPMLHKSGALTTQGILQVLPVELGILEHSEELPGVLSQLHGDGGLQLLLHMNMIGLPNPGSSCDVTCRASGLPLLYLLTEYGKRPRGAEYPCRMIGNDLA